MTTRLNNYFTDEKTGRVLQVVSGRRPDLTGVFRFILANSSLDRLRASADSWVALVPSVGETFLLVPTEQVRWRGERLVDAYVTLRFDRTGKPQEMAEWAVQLQRKGSKL